MTEFFAESGTSLLLGWLLALGIVFALNEMKKARKKKKEAGTCAGGCAGCTACPKGAEAEEISAQEQENEAPR